MRLAIDNAPIFTFDQLIVEEGFRSQKKKVKDLDLPLIVLHTARPLLVQQERFSGILKPIYSSAS